jgi:hypothetical protein
MVALSPTTHAAGPQSVYYVTDDQAFGSNYLVGIQGTGLAMVTTMVYSYEQAIAVGTTIRTLSFGGYPSAEYTLAGVPTGTTYTNPSGSDFYDGTTDGVYNYAWSFDSGSAYRFASDWTAPELLFTVGNANGDRLGITYDSANNSLWVSGYGGDVANTVTDYSLAGAVLSSFALAPAVEYTALAMDPADHTLWMYKYGDLQGTFVQYSTSGTLLDTESYASHGMGGARIWYGGEFAQPVPEPGACLLLTLGGVLLLGRRTLRTNERNA